MKRVYLILFIILIACINSFSQRNTIKIAKPKPAPKTDSTALNKQHWFFVAPVIGYVWQGYNNIELGVRPLVSVKPRSHANASLTLGCDIFKHYKTNASPFISVRYFDYLHWGLAWNISCAYSFTTGSGITDQRITPEIGVGYQLIHLSYGYNIPIGNEKLYFISPHRIALRFTFF